MRRLLPLLVAGLALACASSRGLRPLSETLPSGVPTTEARAAWQRISGDYEAGNDHVRYALFVDPRQPLLFRITQFRVTRRGVGGSGPHREDAAETVIWNETPGQRVPLKCFEEERPAAGQPAARSVSWRDVTPGSPQFVDSMRRAMEIYHRVQEEGRAGPPVS
jgi:hypothetical protein